MEFIDAIHANAFIDSLKENESLTFEDIADKIKMLLDMLILPNKANGTLGIALSYGEAMEKFYECYDKCSKADRESFEYDDDVFFADCHVELFGYWRYFFEENINWENSCEESSASVECDVRVAFTDLYGSNNEHTAKIDEDYRKNYSICKVDADFSICEALCEIAENGSYEELEPEIDVPWKYYDDLADDPTWYLSNDENDFIFSSK